MTPTYLMLVHDETANPMPAAAKVPRPSANSRNLKISTAGGLRIPARSGLIMACVCVCACSFAKLWEMKLMYECICAMSRIEPTYTRVSTPYDMHERFGSGQAWLGPAEERTGKHNRNTWSQIPGHTSRD